MTKMKLLAIAAVAVIGTGAMFFGLGGIRAGSGRHIGGSNLPRRRMMEWKS